MLEVQSDRFWRRLVVIALEDIGIGDLDLVCEVLGISGRRVLRQSLGGDYVVAEQLDLRLCGAAKSQDACELVVIADQLPALADERLALSLAPTLELQKILSDQKSELPERALAAWYLAGTRRFPAEKLLPREGHMHALLEIYDQLGPGHQALLATKLGATRTQEPHPVTLPLVWLKAQESEIIVRPEPVPTLGTIRGWPSEAFDMHTRSGRRALNTNLNWSTAMKALLANHLLPSKQAAFVGLLIFRMEGVAENRRVQYSGSTELEQLAKTAQLTGMGTPPSMGEEAEAILLGSGLID